MEGILNFPPPRGISGARSFFGLVNQASYAFSMREVMQQFRDLLKKGNKFEWTAELQQLFEEVKHHIVELVKEGVRIFEMKKPTCLATDWCRQGVGFVFYLAGQLKTSCQSNHTSSAHRRDGVWLRRTEKGH